MRDQSVQERYGLELHLVGNRCTARGHCAICASRQHPVSNYPLGRDGLTASSQELGDLMNNVCKQA